ncbi:hypothetical protein DPMN_157219 [Dreissena polymorpha]|uniref:Uncharacterized protein n=1 Tax=Dreissena polymorpha TaxID=45954 RepID=A0A9D4EGQ0_DREPO|nr:hypothetical protein DPMN_157219 [Dreissena polymorpha]
MMLTHQQDILNTHMMGLLPDTGKQYADPVSTPIISHIKQSFARTFGKENT